MFRYANLPFKQIDANQYMKTQICEVHLGDLFGGLYRPRHVVRWRAGEWQKAPGGMNEAGAPPTGRRLVAGGNPPGGFVTAGPRGPERGGAEIIPRARLDQHSVDVSTPSQ